MEEETKPYRTPTLVKVSSLRELDGVAFMYACCSAAF